MAGTFVDMFSNCLSKLLNAGWSVEIDGVGTVEKLSLFPEGLNHRNNIALARMTKKKMVSFKASKFLVAWL